MAKRRIYSREFKLRILEEIRNKPIAQVAKEHSIHPVQIQRWKREHEVNPKKAFAGHGKICKLESELAHYQQLVGKLYARNDFLKKASESLKARLAEERAKQR